MGDLSSLNIDPATDKDTSREPIPAGTYPVLVSEAVVKRTKDLTGHYLQLELIVIDGPHKERKLWDRINFQNTNDQAVQIARATLASICLALDLPTIADSQQIVGKVMDAKVVVRPASGQYEASNEVKKYLKHGGGASAPAAAASSDPSRPPF